MAGFFKSIGKGLLYIVLFPILLIAIAFYGVYGLIVFVYELIKMIILFFSGKTLSSDLDEDIKAKAILAGKPIKDEEDEEEDEEKKEDDNLSLYPSNSPMYVSGPYNITDNTNNDNKVENIEHKEEEEVEVKLVD